MNSKLSKRANMGEVLREAREHGLECELDLLAAIWKNSEKSAQHLSKIEYMAFIGVIGLLLHFFGR